MPPDLELVKEWLDLAQEDLDSAREDFAFTKPTLRVASCLSQQAVAAAGDALNRVLALLPDEAQPQ
ncbi:MAG: hypothetical protein HRF50_11735 [Phycisphaerae bacterium]|jgi:HEPN domain-containing protein